MDVQCVLRNYEWNLQYAEALVRDLSDEEWTLPGGPGLENHPAWVIGHLVSGADLLAKGLGLPRQMPADWVELFERRGPGDPRLPSTDRAAYPTSAELLGELRRQHERVSEAWRVAEREGRLDTPAEWRFRDASAQVSGRR